MMKFCTILNRSKKGFSLIEFIIYFGILASVSVLVVNLMINAARDKSLIDVRTEVQQNLRYSMLRITQAIHQATGVTSASGSTLTLAMSDAAKNPTVFGVSGELVGSWYNASWTRRKALTITNTNLSTLTDFQTQITVTYDSDMQADFDDILFTSSDETTLIPHWLESKTDSSTATFWVKVPSIPASSTATIYMYYGNSGASSASSIANTFLFGDDFSASLDAKWTITQGSPSTSGGNLVLDAGEGVMAGGYSIPANTIWESSADPQNTGGVGSSMRAATTSLAGFVHDGGANIIDMLWWYGTWYAEWNASESGVGSYAAGFKKYKITYRPADVDQINYDYNSGATTYSHSDGAVTGIYPVLYSSAGQSLTDYFFIRQYAASAPTVTSTGAEENYVPVTSNAALQITEGEGTAQDLTGEKVTITGLTFTKISNVSLEEDVTRDTVQISITMSYKDEGNAQRVYSQSQTSTVSLK